MADPKSALLIDIGSASVGACIAEKNGAGTVVVSHTVRSDIKNVSGAETQALERLAPEALQKTLATMREAATAPQEVHVFLAAPWYKAAMHTIRLSSERTLRITRGTIEKAIRDHRTEQKDAPGAGERAIESVVSQTYVNDYPTTATKLLRGSTLAIDLYESATDAAFAEKIEQVIREAYPRAKIHFHTFLFSLFTILRALRSEESFVLADIGGEITDIAVVSRQSMRFEGTFPLGALSLLRAIAGEGSAADAASRLTLYVDGELSEQESAAFKKTYAAASAAWVQGYRSLIEQALREGAVSGTAFIVADKEPLPWFAHLISKTGASFSQKPVLMTPDFFQSYVGLGPGGRYDLFLTAAALSVFHIPEQPPASGTGE